MTRRFSVLADFPPPPEGDGGGWKVAAPQAPTDEDSLLRCPPAPRHEEGEPRWQRDSPS